MIPLLQLAPGADATVGAIHADTALRLRLALTAASVPFCRCSTAGSA